MTIVLIAPTDKNLLRCRIVEDCGTRRCISRGRRFTNLVIHGEPLVVCGRHAESIKPSAHSTIKPVSNLWVDQSIVERNHPWHHDPLDEVRKEHRRWLDETFD